jgi:DNA-binding FrmR family transcriptional regulator
MLVPETQAAIARRLTRVETRVGHIAELIRVGAPCPQLLGELASLQEALSQVAVIVSKFHVERCIISTDGLSDGAQMQELIEIFDRFLA